MNWQKLFTENDGKTAERLFISRDAMLHKIVKHKAKTRGMTLTQYAWCVINRKYNHKCLHCKQRTSMLKGMAGWNQFCSRKCANVYTRRATKATVLEKYGVENVSQIDEVKQKKIRTCLTNYGVEHPQQSKRVRKTTRKVMLERYGADNPSRVDRIKQKRVATFRRNWGVDNPMHNPELRDRVARASAAGNARRKTIKIRGRTFNYMGYEHFALTYFAEFGVKNLCNQCTPVKYSIRNKEHLYVPDMRFTAPSGKKWIVEVKSAWTVGFNRPEVWKTVKAKAQAAEALANFAIMVFKPNGEYVRLTNVGSMSYKEMRRILIEHAFDI